jgi:hypothetical protein
VPARGVPLLALALAAAAASQLQLDDDAEARLRVSFTQAVSATDAADRVYRAAIEAALPRESAHRMLSTMAAFREMVQQIREAAMRELDEIWRRYNRSYGWFDPLDTYAAPPHGLNHVDATRAATIADRARGQVEALRGQANETVAEALTARQVETLRDDKLRRRQRFRTALQDALREALGAPVEQAQIDALLDRLTLLTEGWY